MSRILALAAALTFLLPIAAAQAGTYHVYTCFAAGKTWANGAWKTARLGGRRGLELRRQLIGLTVPAGARMANNTSAALTFTSPAGTTIADFTLTRQIGFTNPVAADTHRYFLLYSLGATHFAGAGNFQDPTRDALNAAEAVVRLPGGQRRRGQEHGQPREASQRSPATPATANQLFLRVGCFNRSTPARSTPAARSATSSTART